MTQADSVLSTPPTNTSAIDQPMMFPLVDPTRRRFLAVAAVASVVSAGTLAAATVMDPSVPAAVTIPAPRASSPDPVFGLIEAHRKAHAAHVASLELQNRFERRYGIGAWKLDLDATMPRRGRCIRGHGRGAGNFTAGPVSRRKVRHELGYLHLPRRRAAQKSDHGRTDRSASLEKLPRP